MKESEKNFLESVAKASDFEEFKFENLQRTARAMQNALIITNDYLTAVMAQVQDAQKSINQMLSICNKNQKLLEKNC